MSRSVILLLVMAALAAPAFSQSRLAEITDVQGVRDNTVRGVGLVIGLNKSGDKAAVSRRMIASVLARNQINALDGEVASGNIAVVMVTARIDPFRRPGSKIDVTVSSLQDASSLYGGTLLETHLTGFDRKTVYAIAEGALSVGGVGAEGQSGSSVTINHPTVGSIPNGALVEKEIPMQVTDRRGVITLNLRNQNWATARNAAAAINAQYPGAAKAITAGSVEIMPPDSFASRTSELLASVLDLKVEVHTVSKVVIDSRTGIIVAGQDVRISTVAVAQGRLSVTIRETPEPVVAAPFTEGPAIAAVPRSEVTIEEENSGLQVVQGGETVAKLAMSLNALGASPRQLIAIFEAIKAAGALQAELVVK